MRFVHSLHPDKHVRTTGAYGARDRLVVLKQAAQASDFPKHLIRHVALGLRDTRSFLHPVRPKSASPQCARCNKSLFSAMVCKI